VCFHNIGDLYLLVLKYEKQTRISLNGKLSPSLTHFEGLEKAATSLMAMTTLLKPSYISHPFDNEASLWE
jgi:hypothetical protein